jgi:hypothetical protein
MPPGVRAVLEARDESLSTALTRTVLRYVAILAHERRELRPHFSASECALILDACNGTAFMDAMSVRLLPDGVEDAIQYEQLDAKWDVNGDALMAKLRSTTFAQRMALVDAIQRWWDAVQPGEPSEYGTLLDDPQPDQAAAMAY